MHANHTFAAIRALLFIPAVAKKHLAAAARSGADAFVVDLEDSIARAQKAAARAALGEAIAMLPNGRPRMVRVNATGRWLREDLHAAVSAGFSTVLLPKVESAKAVAAAAEILEAAERKHSADADRMHTRIIAGIESPKGVMHAREIAGASERVCGLGFGCDDYSAELGVPAATVIVDYAAQQVALSARAASMAALGMPGSIINISDIEGFRRLAYRGRMMGFTGHFCIHPSQCTAARDAWRPAEATREWAAEVMAAKAAMDRQGTGVLILNGQMIDVAVVRQAEEILRSKDDVAQNI